MPQRVELHQTTMCNRGDACKFYNKIDGSRTCWFAHSVTELRCKDFALRGSCRKGESCDRKHTLHKDILSPTASKPMVWQGGGRPKPVIVSFGRRPDREGPPLVHHIPRYELPPELPVAASREEAVKRGGFACSVTSAYLTSRYTVGSLSGVSSATKKLNIFTDVPSCREHLQEFLQRCLEVEYCQELSDMRRYDIEDCIIDTVSRVRGVDLFRIDCDGLQEKRPSVLRGDKIVVRNKADGRYHAGYVYFVNLDHVLVQFDERFFKPSKVVPYHVEFRLSETPFHRQFHALGAADTVFARDEVFAEPPVHLTIDDLPHSVQHIIAHSVGGKSKRPMNPLQMECVLRLVHANPTPGSLGLFLLHGPPGTGKTTTLVGFLQVLLALVKDRTPLSTTNVEQQRLRKQQVLVCCPSNHAADLICEKLMDRVAHIDPLKSGAVIKPAVDIVRICSASYDVSKIHHNVRRCVPPMDQHLRKTVGTATVVVCTMMSAGYLWSLGVPVGTFDHIIVDEAGQSMETELLVPMLFASKRKGTHVTLAGDHEQLGAIIRSRVASQFDFSRSTLERLSTTPTMSHHMIQLRQSYRAHPELLNLYNTLTYKGTLSADGPEGTVSALVGSQLFPVPERPVAFYHVDGEESRDRDSPSWKNEAEAEAVLLLLRALILSEKANADNLPRQPLKLEDVVILTPYNRQISEIRRRLHALFKTHGGEKTSAWYIGPEGYKKGDPLPVKVVSVEQFQGREAMVVIMSCVRSRKSEQLDADLAQGIGFLKQPKRLNVAISRAIAGLFIIGNVAALQAAEDLNHIPEHTKKWTGLTNLIADPDARQSSVAELRIDEEDKARAKQLSHSEMRGMCIAYKKQQQERVQRIAAAAAAAAPPVPPAPVATEQSPKPQMPSSWASVVAHADPVPSNKQLSSISIPAPRSNGSVAKYYDNHYTQPAQTSAQPVGPPTYQQTPHSFNALVVGSNILGTDREDPEWPQRSE